MALERLTQITEVGIQSGITLRNVNVEGAYVSGVVTATSLNITGGGANFVGVVTATSFNGNVTGNITPTGLVVSGVSTFQSSSFWGDGDIAYFGDGQDLLIFHNSTDSIIRDNGTGDLYIEGGNRIRLTNPTAIETYAVFNQDGASELYYDNVKRLETSGIGVSVTGSVIASGVSTFSSGVVVSAGSTSAPSISPSGDSNTGIFFPSADTISFAEGGVEAFRITSTGQLQAIGAADVRLTLGSGGTAGTNDSVHIRADGANLKFMNASGGATIFEQNGTERVRIDSSGRVTMPYQPAWNLRPNGNSNVTTTTNANIVGWSNNTSGSSAKLCHIQGVTLTGSSSGIHGATSSGRINFPVAGRYKVWCTIRCENMPGTGNIYFYINGVQLSRQHVEAWGSTYGMPYHHGFQSQIINVAANDFLEIEVSVTAGAIISGYNDTVNWCGGYLIG